eukprot:maker-scaffold2832_size12053-snap-gene-0.0 protein:Tk09906 transcript:maker-scaffold2832_size12053-snap-gene-0.0-mRNA-1 annotation:"hypothetical protein"
MPGKFSLYQDLTVEENLQFFATIFGTTIAENYDLIKDIYVQIAPFKNRRAGKLSGGMKQKLALCCALIHKPKVLFLDEPTTGVDPVSRKEFWEMLKRLQQKDITILVSTPYMDEAALCDRIALLQDGANGAGKTTAMKMLIGISNPTSGEATVAGFEVFTQAENIKKNIGYMSQKFALYDDLTVRENITFFGGIYGLSRKKIKEKSDELIQDLGLENVANQLVGSLPLGWKQKISFSVSLLHDPKIVFLDEPTGGVDPITRRQFWELIYKAAAQGTTVFVTTHYMDEAEYCDRVSI